MKRPNQTSEPKCFRFAIIFLRRHVRDGAEGVDMLDRFICRVGPCRKSLPSSSVLVWSKCVRIDVLAGYETTKAMSRDAALHMCGL